MRVIVAGLAALAALAAAPAAPAAAAEPSMADEWASICLVSYGDPARASMLADEAGWQKDDELAATFRKSGALDYADARYRIDAQGRRHALGILRDKAVKPGHEYRWMQCMITVQGAADPIAEVTTVLKAEPAGIDDGVAIWMADATSPRPTGLDKDEIERAKALAAHDSAIIVHAGVWQSGDGFISYEGPSTTP